MASISKRPDSSFWIAAFRAADGRRVKISTKTTDRREAKRIADRLELEARESRETRKATASMSGINSTMARAAQLAVSGNIDAHSARSLINDLLTAAGQPNLDLETHRSWCDSWRISKAGAVKERSHMKYEQVTRNWLHFLDKSADSPLDALTRKNALAYRDKMAKDGLAPRTVNQTIKLLRSIYTDAVEQGHLGRNPFVGIDPLREDSDEASRLPFTPAEVSTLISSAEGDWKGLIILSATTGLRLMDAARIKWNNIDLATGVMKVKTAKTGTTLTLPVHPSFQDWLNTQHQGIGAAPVFPSLADKGGAGKSGLSMAFKRIMERAGVSAGIARPAKDKSRGRTTSQKSFHSLRHFAASQLASSGIRADIARAITGHANAGTHANYVTADIEILKNAVSTIKLSA